MFQKLIGLDLGWLDQMFFDRGINQAGMIDLIEIRK